jgi:hypothetical protein
MKVPVTALGKGLRVELVDFYGNNIMWACIADEGGQSASICIDARNNSSTRNRLFQQARHPNKPGAKLIELGSVEEGIVIPLLSHYIDLHGPKAEGPGEYFRELAREVLLHYGEPPV